MLIKIPFNYRGERTQGECVFRANGPNTDIPRPGYGNDYLPWLYTQPLQNIGGANVCIVLGK